MRSWLFVFLIACGGGTKTPPSTVSPPPPAAGSSAPMIAQGGTEVQPQCAEANVACAIDTLAYFSKQMCFCKNKGCAEGVNNSMTKWGEEMSKKPVQNVKPTEGEQKQVMEIVTKYTDCMTKLMMDGQAPPVDPSDPCGGGNPCGD